MQSRCFDTSRIPQVWTRLAGNYGYYSLKIPGRCPLGLSVLGYYNKKKTGQKPSYEAGFSHINQERLEEDFLIHKVQHLGTAIKNIILALHMLLDKMTSVPVI